MSGGPNEWTFCTEHQTGAVDGACAACGGDRNLVQVVRRYYLDVAHTQLDRERARLKLAAVLLREVLSGADILTNKKWMRAAEELGELLQGLTSARPAREETRDVSRPGEGPDYAEEFLISVSYHRSPDHLIRRGNVMADMGFPCPDPPPTNEEMQAVTFAAKMAMCKVVRARRRGRDRT